MVATILANPYGGNTTPQQGHITNTILSLPSLKSFKDIGSSNV